MDMKKYYVTLICSFLLFSCGAKQTRKAINTGNYDFAIQKSVQKLQGNKTSKRKQKYVFMLEEAFAKAKERDLRNITTWSNDPNSANFEKIFNTYLQLNKRQESIRPLLPLSLLSLNKNATFIFDDYSDELLKSKNAFASYLYENSKRLLDSKIKMNYRKAYDDLKYLQQIHLNYKDSQKLMDEALSKGVDYVIVTTKNETNTIIPTRLERDLLDFNTFGLNDLWTVYHSSKTKEKTYDYGVVIQFREIQISPEQIKEKEFIREKEVKDGSKPLLNEKGQPSRDANGKIIMVDQLKTVVININEIRQFKACQVVAKVDYVSLTSNQLIGSYPINSEFIFEHIYANYNGDKRACDSNYLTYFNNKVVPFPSSEQMVYDAGQDLKNKIKNIIVNNRLRR